MKLSKLLLSTKAKKILLGFGILTGVFMLGFLSISYILEFNEPQYNGHSISYWIRNCVLGPYEGMIIFEINRDSQEAVGSIGKESVPHLQKALRRKSNFLRSDGVFSKYYEKTWNTLPKRIQKVFVHPGMYQTRRTAQIHLIKSLDPQDQELLIPDLIQELASFKGLEGHAKVQVVIETLLFASIDSLQKEKVLLAIHEFRDQFPENSREFQWVDGYLNKGTENK